MSEKMQRTGAEKSASTPSIAPVAKPAPKRATAGEAAADLSAPGNAPAPPGHSLSRIGIHYGAPAPIQAKLTVGPVNDQYEREADSVAQRVVEQINAPVAQRQALPKEDEEKVQTKPLISSIQRQEMPEEEELQTKSLADSIQREETPQEDEEMLQTKALTSAIQRQEGPEDEENLQAKPLVDAVQRQETPQEDEELLQTKRLASIIQRQAMPDEEEKLQTKSLGNMLQRQETPEDEEKIQTKSLAATLQRQETPEDEDMLQTKAAGNALQRQADQDDETLQGKAQIQRRADGSMAATPALESAIQQSRGSGQSLSDSTRQPLERAFGADFSRVKVHTDARADQLNRSIQARAFTTGQDIYFRQGEHSPGTRAGQELLAHELTHVVQQTGETIRRNGGPATPRPTIAIATTFAAPDGTPNTRKKVGVGEEVTFTASAVGRWTATRGTPGILASGNTFTWKAPNRKTTATITVKVGKASKRLRIKVVEPQSIKATKNSEIPGTPGVAGAGMWLNFHFSPKNVSFGNVEHKEIPGPATGISGYFKKHFTKAFLTHNPNPSFLPIGQNNQADGWQDQAAWHGITPTPYRRGSFKWVIPNHFKVKTEGGNGKKFTKVTQAFSINKSGKVKITKAGAKVERTP